METSLLKTLAAKHRSTVTKIARNHKAIVDTAEGPRVCLRTIVKRGEGSKPLVAWFGGIPLTRQKKATLIDRTPALVLSDAPYEDDGVVGCDGVVVA